MSGHYSALVNVKSTMNTREKPFVHVKKQTQAKQRPSSTVQTKKQDEEWLKKMLTTEYDEQRETFRRCTNAKSEVASYSQNNQYKQRVKKMEMNKKANHSNF